MGLLELGAGAAIPSATVPSVMAVADRTKPRREIVASLLTFIAFISAFYDETSDYSNTGRVRLVLKGDAKMAPGVLVVDRPDPSGN